VGDRLGVERFWMAGFIEARNQKEFSQEVLPNHQWRGFLRAESDWTLLRSQGYRIRIPVAYFHESGHATAGMFVDGESPTHEIWDGVYRNVHLNALESGILFESQGPLQWFVDARSQFYFYSRNTPEARNLQSSLGGGASLAMEGRWNMDEKNGLFVSGFARVLGEGADRVKTAVNFWGITGIEKRTVDYPIIARVWSVSVATGYVRYIQTARREIALFGQYFEGYPGGYADSRQHERRFAVGLGLGI
jgi:hypothetical protein